MLVAYGTYTGNEVDNRAITGIGFQPNFVLIKRIAAKEAVCRSSDMSGDNTKVLTGTLNFFANGIQSLDTDGFTVGTDWYVNKNGETYCYIAIKAATADCKVLSYTGNGVDNRSITGVGFQSDLVLIWEGTNFREPFWKTSDMAGDTSQYFKGALAANYIQALETDGFQIGTVDNVNGSGIVYYALCLKNLATAFKAFTYTGNGGDSRSITGVGFLPDFVLVKHASATNVAFVRFTAEAGDASMPLDNSSGEVADHIQALESDGIQVGTAENANTIVYNCIALKIFLAQTSYQTVAATAIGVGGLSRVATYYRTLAGTAIGIATLARILTYIQAINAVAIGSASLSKVATHYITMAVLATGAPVFIKRMFVNITATTLATPIMGIVITAYRTMTATAIGQATLTRVSTFSVSLASVAQGIAALTASYIEGAAISASKMWQVIKKSL